nr:hypothetical protein [uncultured Shinella sp.]
MKFKLVETYRYWWPVIVRMPDEHTPGKMVEHELKVLFEPQPREEAVKAAEAYAKLKTARAQADHEHQQLLAVVKNWDEIEDQDKNPIPFSEASFLQALEFPWFRMGVYNAYTDSLNGIEARVGNSPTPPAPGH